MDEPRRALCTYILTDEINRDLQLLHFRFVTQLDAGAPTARRPDRTRLACESGADVGVVAGDSHGTVGRLLATFA